MASHSVHAWLANPCKSPLSGIPVDRKRWPNKLLFKSACFASMWRHVNWLHGVRIGLDMFGFSWTLRHSDGEQILHVNSQIDGFCVIRGTDVNSGEASHWIASETARGRLCRPSKCGNQRRNDRGKWKQVMEVCLASRDHVTGKPPPQRWYGVAKSPKKKAANETWWVVPFPKKRQKYDQI